LNSKKLMSRCRAVLLLLAALGVCRPQAALADAAGVRANDLAELSIQELMEVQVTSVSRKGQQLSKTASPVYVITAEDIRRSGATSIPEALRMAPGVQVSRLGSNKWAIGIRGFNNRFSNKLLVMIDGRSVYTPLFAGVDWDVQDTLLDDIDRIEVVRGPGGTMWGSNAVNGVISIITKSAGQTQGGLVKTGWGNQEGPIGEMRYGGKAGSSAHYRVYSKYFQRPGQYLPAGGRDEDDWKALRGGFRLDWSRSERDSLTVSGDVYGGESNSALLLPIFRPPFEGRIQSRAELSGHNILARWTHKHSNRSTSTLQVYRDRQRRDDNTLNQRYIEATDFDYQNEFNLDSRNQLTWGGGYRLNRDALIGTENTSFHPASRSTHLYQTFVQDEARLFSDRLLLTVGTKLEHNSYSGWEVQPTAALLWDRSDNDSAWLSVSRAVRIPSRLSATGDILLQVFPGPAGLNRVSLLGNPAFEAEELIAYQAGYRIRLGQRVSLDLTAFYNDYDKLEQLTFADPSLAPPGLIPTHFVNGIAGRTRGIEAASSWRLTQASAIHLSYSWLDVGLHSDLTGVFPTEISDAEDRAPDHQFHARWYYDLPGGLQWDNGYYFVGSLGSLDVRAYHRVDSRIGWRPSARIELTFGLQNALDNQHPETNLFVRDLQNEIGRSIYGKITYGF